VRHHTQGEIDSGGRQMPQEMNEHPGRGRGGERGKMRNACRKKSKREYSATRMACGWGEGGGQRKGQMRRAGAEKAEGGGTKKWGGCGARAQKRSGCGARVEERAWRCGDDDGVVV